jgi:methylthioribulose-1-phosphate dehydratase
VPTALLSPEAAAAGLVEIGRRFYSRNWVLGTSGNFSAVLSRDPLRLLITPSGAHKGTLSGAELLELNERGDAESSEGRPESAGSLGRPSAETLLHLEIVGARGVGAVLHTHSVWGTILSDTQSSDGGVAIAGYEMLKGLSGVTTHEHREWVPIIDNDQDMTRLAVVVRRLLQHDRRAHAFLLRGHGLYTWGASLAEAERHIEILEFLFETVGRTSEMPGGGAKTPGRRHHHPFEEPD